jgi:2-polyprenyl-6-methoxyphenol hydroxylase-like FAD-dependent oxidoreductase
MINAASVHRMSVLSWRGRRLSEIPVDPIAERYRVAVVFVHRADLQASLATRLRPDGLHLGAHVSGFQDHGASVQVTLYDGTAHSGDLLVGADGLRSAVRRQLLGDGDPVYLGSTIWRGIAPSLGIDLPTGSGFNWVGRGSEFVGFHLTENRIYWAGVSKESNGEKPGPGGHKQDVLERFGAWVQPVPNLIAATDDAAIVRNDMYDRPPARRWSRGRVTLVGDAAHPMTPNAGQGACQALEDAVALGDSVSRTSNLTEAFRLYEDRRLRRANRLVAMARQATRASQIDNRVLCALRDGAGKLVPPWLVRRMMDSTLGGEQLAIHR